MFNKVKEMVGRFEEIEHLLTKPEIVQDRAKFSALMKERGQLQKIVTRYRNLEDIRNQKAQAEELANDGSSDLELKKVAKEEVAELIQKEESLISELEDIMLTEDSESQRNVIVEIRPGTGGEEAALFAGDLFRMYSKYADKKGWRMEVMEMSDTDLGGVKQVIFSLEGTDVYKYMKYESGTHRVQRVPRTEAQGRIHTSACTVAVLHEAEEVEIDIRKEDLQIDVYRASGAGGQHVNKTSSAVRITHLPTGTVVACQAERSQHRNRDLAMKWLRAKLYEHFNSQKKQERDNMRKVQVGTGDRSEKIRTYNFPQSRVTDHRITFSVHNLETFLDGDIDEMVAKLLEYEKEEKLKALAKSK